MFKRFMMILFLLIFCSFFCGIVSAADVNLKYGTNSKPDLVVSAVYASPVFDIYGYKRVSYQVKNRGSVRSKGFYTNFYLIKTSTGSKYFLGKRYISSLTSGKIVTLTTKFFIYGHKIGLNPGQSGKYYVLAKADSTNNVIESNEKNNLKVSNIVTIVRAPQPNP
jgi:subtilase family serine protease